MCAYTRFQRNDQARAECDPAFRDELLVEGVESFLYGDVNNGKAVLRNYINAAIGFGELTQVMQRSTKSISACSASLGIGKRKTSLRFWPIFSKRNTYILR